MEFSFLPTVTGAPIVKRHVLVTVTAVAALLAAHQIWKTVELRRLHRTLDDLRAEGFPTRGADLVPAALPDDENAAPRYEAAIALAKIHGHWAPDATVGDRADDAEPTPDELRAELLAGAPVDALVELRDALDLAVEGSALPSCAFSGTSAALDSPERFGHSMDVVRLASLLCARALVTADLQPDGPSARDLRAAFAIGRHLGEDSILLAQLVRLTIATHALEATRALLADAPDPEGFLAAVAPDETDHLVARALTGEMVFVEIILEHALLWDALGLGPDGPGFLQTLIDFTYRPADLASTRRHLARLRRAATAARLPGPDALRALADLTEEARDGGRVERAASIDFARILEHELAYAHELALTRVGAGLLAAERRTGALPDDLSAFSEDDLDDPATGAAMEWITEAGARVLRAADREDRWTLSRP